MVTTDMLGELRWQGKKMAIRTICSSSKDKIQSLHSIQWCQEHQKCFRISGTNNFLHYLSYLPSDDLTKIIQYENNVQLLVFWSQTWLLSSKDTFIISRELVMASHWPWLWSQTMISWKYLPLNIMQQNQNWWKREESWPLYPVIKLQTFLKLQQVWNATSCFLCSKNHCDSFMLMFHFQFNIFYSLPFENNGCVG